MPWHEMPSEPRPPRRRQQDYGTLGRKIRLKANFFTVQVKNPNISIFHYDVDIKDPKIGTVNLPKPYQFKLFEEMKCKYPKVFQNTVIGYDCNKNCYSIGSIPSIKKNGSHFEIETGDSEKSRLLIITLKLVAMENLSSVMSALQSSSTQPLPLSVMQMLEVLLQHQPTLKYEKVGRNMFFPMGGEFGPSYSVGGGKEGVVGFFGSLRPVGWKKDTFLLNIDVANAVYYKEQNLIDFVCEALRCSAHDLKQPLDHRYKRQLQKDLRDIKVQSTHTQFPRKYKVLGVGDLGADRQTFPLNNEDGSSTNITVQHYFLQQYGYKLQYPHFNCIKAGPASRNIYLPMEVCKIAKGQKVRKKLNKDETGQFIRSTARLPMQRLNTISSIVRQQNYSNDAAVRALQFSISDQPICLDGRVLPAPNVLMNVELAPDKGVWDSRDHTFYEGGQLKCWAVLNYDGGFVRDDELSKFLGFLCRMGKERGMSVTEAGLVKPIRYPNPEQDLQEVKKRLPSVQLVMIVLPKFQDYYARVKKTGDREVGVMTQCVQGVNVKKCQLATISNLLLKINAKIGGTNNVLGAKSRPVVFSAPVMIMGADVNHPPAHDRLTPSLAAVVASLDRYACKYAVEVRHQKHRTEMIQELRDMTKNLLKAFYKSTSRKPQRIIMYRDGVSESQFAEVLSSELKAMRDACMELESGYEPAMTFICVQKRHHTRLFCQERDGVGRSKNIPPGTTVDTVITHPVERDFYLCSHQGILGTSRPTHYHVLWDDGDLDMDQLQSLTYAMCHLYSRCTRSVSIPAPAYYAHLVAFRAKVHIHDLCDSESGSLSSGEAEGVPDAVMARAAKMDHINELSNKLYYV